MLKYLLLSFLMLGALSLRAQSAPTIMPAPMCEPGHPCQLHGGTNNPPPPCTCPGEVSGPAAPSPLPPPSGP